MASKCNQDRQGINLDSLSERLRKSGMKLTNQRRELLHVLLHHPEPISADEIFKKIDSSESMDLVTIYRCLKKFEESGLVTRMDFGDGISRFEVTAESGHHHHHVICRECQKVEPLHICDLDPHIKMVEKMGYGAVSHRLDFFGICAKCQK